MRAEAFRWFVRGTGFAAGAVVATAILYGMLIVAVVYIVIQTVEGNVLIPMVMHNTIGIPPFIVFVSILAGATIAGIPGAPLSVPLAAGLLVVVERLQAREQRVALGVSQPPEEVAELVARKTRRPSARRPTRVVA